MLSKLFSYVHIPAPLQGGVIHIPFYICHSIQEYTTLLPAQVTLHRIVCVGSLLDKHQSAARELTNRCGTHANMCTEMIMKRRPMVAGEEVD